MSDPTQTIDTERDEESGLHLPKGTKQWICTKGHVLDGSEPYEMALTLKGQVLAKSGPVCPKCITQFFRKFKMSRRIKQ